MNTIEENQNNMAISYLQKELEIHTIALGLMAEAFSSCDFCPISNTIECPYTEDVKFTECNNAIINYFKKQALGNNK